MSETTDKTVASIPDAITLKPGQVWCGDDPYWGLHVQSASFVFPKIALVHDDGSAVDDVETAEEAMRWLKEHGYKLAYPASEEQPSVMVSQDCNQTERVIAEGIAKGHPDSDDCPKIYVGGVDIHDFLETGKRYRITELPEVCTPAAQRKEGEE